MNFCRRIILTLFALMPTMASVAKSVPFYITDGEEEIVRKLTLREKTRLVVGAGYGSLLSGFAIPFCKGNVLGAAGETNDIKRLGIRPLVLSDGPAGLRLRKTRTTAFPIGSLLACSWDTAYVASVGMAMGREAVEHGVDVVLAPGMNLMRNPLCGRNFEYFSEDPLLTGRMAAAVVRGIQSQGVGACAKHFAANNQETNRKHNDSRIDSLTLRELYLKPFEIVVREAKPWTVMSSYNLLNGELTQQSHWLLTDVLRKEWGYDGLVMTDWTGKRNTTAQLHAGNDLIMPGLKRQRWQLKRAVKRGELSEKELDEAVGRVLRLGKLTAEAKDKEDTSDSTQNDICRRASEGMVLLENRDGTLPFSLTGKRIALFGATSYEMIVGGTGSGHVNVSAEDIIDLPEALEAGGAVLDGELASQYHRYIRKRSSRYPSTFYLNRFLGKGGLKEKKMDVGVIEQCSERTDLAIITLGRQAGEGKDRQLKDDFLLTEAERQLLQDVTHVYHNVGKRVVVILNVGGVIETASWKHLPDAILLAWLPGQWGGASIADILTGRVNPSGHLCMTWPVHYEDHPSAAHFPEGGKDGGKDNEGKKCNIDYTCYEEGMNVGYRYFHDQNVPVSYPFGYGLSYTDFHLGDPVVSVDAEGNLEAVVEVANEGRCEGKDVVQLYGKAPNLPTQLLTFAKTPLLKPGEHVSIRLSLPSWLMPRGVKDFWVK